MPGDTQISSVRERSAAARAEIVVAGCALLGLLLVQWLLSAAIHGTNYDGADGKMAQAVILTAYKFAGFFDVTVLNPIEGMGSQLLTFNVWANPAHWPFAFLGREAATDVSALIALAIFAAAAYAMARCFDLAVVPSAIAAQLSIAIFAPVLNVLGLSTVFSINPDDAVVFAPHMIALGLLARLEPGAWRRFVALALAVFGLLLLSVYCDPLWSMVHGFSWSVPFVLVTFAPMRWRNVGLRLAALACCAAFLLATGVLDYLYTLSHYTYRVQFAEVIDRARVPAMASALFFSPAMKYFYLAWIPGWLLGLVTLNGRARVLVLTGMGSAIFLFFYGAAFLLVKNAIWLPPLPMYVEQNLFPLFLAAAVAGYWGALAALGALARRKLAEVRRPLSHRAARAWLPASLAAVAVVPFYGAYFAQHQAAGIADLYHEPWPNEPELVNFASQHIGLTPGGPFRGSVHFWTWEYYVGLSLHLLWAHDVPSVEEYSQLVTPPAFYFLYGVLGNDDTGSINRFMPFPAPSWKLYWNVLQLLGTRYYIDLAGHDAAAQADAAGYHATELPHRPLVGAPGTYRIYELPHPNLGNYSPTEVAVATTGDEISAQLRSTSDLSHTAVLTESPGATLVPATDARMSRTRGGIHLSGHSDGTSLLVLPQQFSRCLRAHDPRVRLVRADLLLTGVIFSGDLDTDISFDYGLFNARCRYRDLAESRALNLKINYRMPHLSGPLFFRGQELVSRLRTIESALQ